MVSSVALDRALIVLFEQHRSDEADDGILVGKMPTTSGAPLDLAVFSRSSR
jgi:hypothetical protein